MISLGMLSAYSSYTENSKSVYGVAQVSSTKNEQTLYDNENPSTDSSFSDDINDEAIISDKAKELFEKDKSDDSKETQDSKQSNDKPLPDENLSSEQQQEITELKVRDAEVRAHEQAHIAAAAGLMTSAPNYDYQTGPDGKKYAVGGEVSISFTKGSSPEEDIQNAEKLKAAALAPVEPSGQDLSVARNADAIIQEARQELTEQKRADAKVENNNGSDNFNLTKNVNNTSDKNDVKN